MSVNTIEDYTLERREKLMGNLTDTIYEGTFSYF